MATYEITAEMNLKKIIAESREVAQALNEFADNLERIEKKYVEPQEARGSDDADINVGKIPEDNRKGAVKNESKGTCGRIAEIS